MAFTEHLRFFGLPIKPKVEIKEGYSKVILNEINPRRTGRVSDVLARTEIYRNGEVLMVDKFVNGKFLHLEDKGSAFLDLRKKGSVKVRHAFPAITTVFKSTPGK